MKKKQVNLDIKQLLGIPIDPLGKFHDLTKFKKWFPAIPVEKWPAEWKVVLFKEYPRLDKIILPKPLLAPDIRLAEVFYKRLSSRKFSRQGLDLQQMSNFLFFSAGLRSNLPPWVANRFYPSPGGRYTLETYLISLNSDLPRGVYHYNLREHSLEILQELKRFKKDYYFNQNWIDQASCIILVTATFNRNTIKYGLRGYRHVLVESGHLGQNFYLVGSALDLSLCAIGGYLDDRLNHLLDIDGITETVIYPIAIGNRLESQKK